MRQNKNQIVVETLINKMFEIAGHQVTYNDIKDRTDAWYTQWTMTEEQEQEWRTWGTVYIKKKFRFTKPMAERQMSMINLMWGLKTVFDNKDKL